VRRFWESRFRDIRPLKRGGNRRYYRPDDVDLLRGIRHLLYGEGYTIRGVQRILREQGPRFVQLVWREGAPQPAHGPSDDDAYDGDAPAGEQPAAGHEPHVGRARPPAQPILQSHPERRLSPEARHTLQAVLGELTECRRLLNAALAEQP
jgi:DNA-binding transcriptional MerR regulator